MSTESLKAKINRHLRPVRLQETAVSTPTALGTLLALPWVQTADRQPEWAKDSRATFLVLTAPVVGGTGRLSACLYFAAYEGDGRWLAVSYPNSFRREPLIGRIVAWLDVTHWELDSLAEQLDQTGAQA